MTLTQLFTNIANAIRAKTGSSEQILAENFPTEIADITTGNLSDEEYQEANDDLDDILEGSTPITIYPPDWSEIGYEDTPPAIIDGFNYAKSIKDSWNSSDTNLIQKFYNDTNLIYMPVVNTGNATNMQGMFGGCNRLVFVPLLDTGNVTNMNNFMAGCSDLLNIPNFNTEKVTDIGWAFSYCSKVVTFPLLDTKNVTNFSLTFIGCSKLVDVPLLNTSKATNMDRTFTQCTKLSNESLNNILKMCINATVYTGTKTLKYIGLTSAQATTCQTLSNYNDFIAAGWTTGY